MKIFMRRPVYPEWVGDIQKEMSKSLKQRLIECIIYSLITKTPNGYDIHEILQDMANRTSHLPDTKEVIGAIAIAESFMADHTAAQKGEQLEYEK